MTVAAGPTSQTIIGDGVTTLFAIGFEIESPDFIHARLDADTPVAGHMIAGSGFSFDVAPAAGVSVEVYRLTPIYQVRSFANVPAVRPLAIEHALDQLTCVQQDLRRDVNASRTLAVEDAIVAGHHALAPSGAAVAAALFARDEAIADKADEAAVIAAFATRDAAIATKAAASDLAAEATLARSASNLTAGTIPASRLPATGVIAGTYGGATSSARFIVGADGRLTAAAEVAITGGGGGAGGDVLAANFLSEFVGHEAAARGHIGAAGLTLSDITRINNNQNFYGVDSNNNGVHALAITDYRSVASPATSFLSGILFAGAIGGPAMTGGRNFVVVTLNITAPIPNCGNTNQVALTPIMNVLAPFTAGSSPGSPRGAIFAMNPVLTLAASASPSGEVMADATAVEIDLDVHAAATISCGLRIAHNNSVQASFSDPMLEFSALGTAAIGKKAGFSFRAQDPYTGVAVPPPLDSSIGQVANAIGAQTVQDVLNFNPMSVTRHVLSANSGQIQLSNMGGIGQLNLRSATNIVSLGSLTAAGQSTLQFFSSGHGAGVVDSSIAGIGGSATVGGGVIAFTAAQMVVPTIRPGADNASDFGSASFRIRDLFLANPPTVTSDARLKHVVGDLADAEFDKLLDAVGSVRLVLFQWLTAMAEKGDAARLHAGVLAQELRDAIAAQGLDPARFGVFCEDELHESVEIEEAVEVPDTEDATEEHQVVEIVDGKAVRRTVVETYQKPKMQTVPLYNEDGSRAMFPKVDQRVRHSPMTDEEGRPLLTKAGKPRMKRHVQKGLPARPATHDVPVTKTVTRKTPTTQPVLDDQGRPVTRLGVRYDQLNILLAAWTRRGLRRLAA